MFIPGIIWKERILLNSEGEASKTKQEILKHAKALVARFLDEYFNAF
jgi:hypothetical protein